MPVEQRTIYSITRVAFKYCNSCENCYAGKKRTISSEAFNASADTNKKQ